MGTEQDPLSGPDRLQVLASFGRPVRVGSAEELAVSDADRVYQALEARDGERAVAYVTQLFPLYHMIITTYLEWAMAVHAGVIERSGRNAERRLSMLAHEKWSAGLRETRPPVAAEAITCIDALLSPARTNSTTVAEFRGPTGPAGSPMAVELNRVPVAAREACVTAIKDAEWSMAREAFIRYQSAVRDRHDLIGRYVAILGTLLAVEVGQSKAVTMLQAGLESCAALAGMWAFVASASPKDVALMLAEHLRTHFSGKDRAGAVQIVEEEHRYRLIFDPCGSGGAMRRASVPGHETR